ncbi:probable G-protein coupled receptor 160 [Pelobates fuscus]|uniref:probable G-protein coupled receptor 160 n=1 Tax=Pelobates fuscus TaxID=191477 RepID=UPI002FE45047
MDDNDQAETFERFEPSCILILIITGKIIMNIFISGAKRRSVSPSFMGYFCLSLAFTDFALLISVFSIHYFQDFAIWGVRFTTYHICLLTQIISHTYGILHYPVFVASGLDYYLTIVKSVHLSRFCSGFLYCAVVLLLWTLAFLYTLNIPAGLAEWNAGVISHQCTFYISRQSFYLSAAIVVTVFMVLVICCFEVVALIRTMKLTTYCDKTVILFSYGNEWPIRSTRCLLTSFLFSFLGTWAPFLLIQIIIIFSCAHIPGYMDMNVAWLYFMNSFLVGVSYSLEYPNIPIIERKLNVDPFIDWKYCVYPFYTEDSQITALKEMPLEVVI